MTKKTALSLAVWLSVAAGFPAAGGTAFRFGLANNAAKRGAEIAGQATSGPVSMPLPVPAAQVTRGVLIWPFGARGGDHPNGHPGIDFQTEVGAPLYATLGGRVREVSDTLLVSQGIMEKTIMVDHDAYQVAYVGPMTNVSVSVGQVIKQGQKIAELSAWPNASPAYGFVHWGVISLATKLAVCPYPLMNATAKREMEDLHARSTYSDKAQFPDICNPCPDGGCR